jgi:hypothetical protein
MRKSCVLLIALLAGTATAEDKKAREAFLESKVPEAQTLCHDQIVNTAKDPDSVKFLDGERYTIGLRMLSNNTINFSVPIMGRNTYGAVLRHEMWCTVYCTAEKGCSLRSLNEIPQR